MLVAIVRGHARVWRCTRLSIAIFDCTDIAHIDPRRGSNVHSPQELADMRCVQAKQHVFHYVLARKHSLMYVFAIGRCCVVF